MQFGGPKGILNTSSYLVGRYSGRRPPITFRGKRKLVGHVRLWATCQPVGERIEFPTERRDTNGPGAVRRKEPLRRDNTVRWGSYEILAFIGAGGMGEVYRAMTPNSARRRQFMHRHRHRYRVFQARFRSLPRRG
jgi:hypothetical protein